MVYLARDRVLDHEVAFAVVNTEGADNTPRTRVPREAPTTERQGSDP